MAVVADTVVLIIKYERILLMVLLIIMKKSFLVKKKRRTQFKTKVQNHTLFITKIVKIVTLFLAKMARSHTLWGRTYLLQLM